MLDTQLRYETSLSSISILTFTPNGTEIVSLKFISFENFSISIFQLPFCEKSIVGLLKIKFSTLHLFLFLDLYQIVLFAYIYLLEIFVYHNIIIKKI